MLNFFRSKNPLIFIFYPLIAFVFIFFLPNISDFKTINSDTPLLLKLLINLISGKYFNTLFIFLSVFMFVLTGVAYNSLVQSLKVVKSFQNMHGLLLLLFSGIIIRYINPLQGFMFLFFFIMTVNSVVSPYPKKTAIFSFFNAGLFLALSSFFLPDIIYFFPVIILGQLIFRTVNFREIATSLIGLAIPYFILISVWFFIFSNFDIIYDIHKQLSIKTVFFKSDINIIISGSIAFVIIIISVFNILAKYRNTESLIQDFYSFCFISGLISLVFFIFILSFDFNMLSVFLVFAIVPVGVFFSDDSRPVFKEIVFDIFLLSVILSQTGFFRYFLV